MRRIPLHRSVLVSSIIAANASLFVAAPSIAQGQQVVLEEIIVTARKRQESIQDVPISMAAFSGDQMRDAGISNVKHLTMQVPGLQIDEQSTAQIWIRGIGQRDDSARVDSPTGVYIDGVYIARKDAQLLDILDPESVQVLRGPQGTLFGKNTTAGAVVVNTRKPNENMGGYIEGRVGNYDRRDAKAVFNLPLVDDTLYSKITLSSVKRDGYQDNVVTGQNMASEDRLNAALQLRWLPVDNVTVDTFLYYNKTREVQAGQNCRLLNQSSYNGQDAMYQNRMWPGDTTAVWPLEGLPIDMATASFLAGIPLQEVSQVYKDACDESDALLKRDKVAMNPIQSFELDNLLAGVTVEWEISDSLSFKSITGYGDQRLGGLSNNGDNDGTAQIFSSRYRTSASDREQISQEFQFTGSALNERLQYTAGIFGMVEDIDDGTTHQFGGVSGFFVPASSVLQAPAPAIDLVSIQSPTVQRDTYSLKNTTYAAFFQGSYDFTDNLQLTLGLRWTSEKRETTLDQEGLDLGAFNTEIINRLGTFGGGLFPTGPLDQAGLGYAPALIPLDILGQIQALFPVNEGIIDYPLLPAQRHKAKKTWTELNPMASLSYTLPNDWLRNTFIDSAMTYITYSEGFKSGTFEPFSDEGLRAVDPEIVKNYEIGFKLDGFDRSVRLNMAAYLMKFDDMQLRQVHFDSAGTPAVVLANASESEIKGVELELTWQPLAGLLINVGASYNEYEFKSFDDTQFSTTSLLTRQPLPVVDRSKEGFPEVPEKTFNIGIQYDWVTDLGTIRPRIDYRYRDDIFLGLDPGAWGARSQSTVDSAEVINARLAWISPRQNWEVALYAHNLTDEDYFFGAAAVGDTIGSMTLQKAPPRMYGLELMYRFGSY